MFCANCGAEARGYFCTKCGACLHDGITVSAVATDDWSEEVRYETLTRIPEVRDLISRHAAMAKKHVSGEEFLAFVDKVTPSGVSLEKLGAIVQPISAKLGIKTGKQYLETLSIASGTVIVRVICSFARNGQVLQRVQQFEDGCLLGATVPSDMWSLEGAIYVSVRRARGGTCVEGTTKIEGQLFDWGKSRRCLEILFADLKATPA